MGQLSKETRPGTGRPWPPGGEFPGREPVAPAPAARVLCSRGHVAVGSCSCEEAQI